MKIGGQKIERMVNIVDVFIPRGENGGFEFKCRAVELDRFETLYPMPEPRIRTIVGEGKVPDLKDAKYLDEMETYNLSRLNYMVVESLKATDDLEWETVNYDDVSTWGNYGDELGEAGFTDLEIGRVIQGVMRANQLDDAFIKEAHANFLARKADLAVQPSSSQTDEPVTSDSGELVRE